MRMKIYSKLIERFKRTLEHSDYILGQMSMEYAYEIMTAVSSISTMKHKNSKMYANWSGEETTEILFSRI